MKPSILCVAGALSVGAAPVAPAVSELPALATLQPGQWALVSRDDPAASRTLCVADPQALLQIEHGKANCSRFVITSSAREATVHYTCPGQGHGRTTIRVETPRLAQIETQGIAAGAPFSAVFEGRRTGACGPLTGMVRR